MSSAAQIALFTDAEMEIRRRVDDAQRSGLLAGATSYVLWYLYQQNAFGKEKAISISFLQSVCDIEARVPSDRAIKDAVKDSP